MFTQDDEETLAMFAAQAAMAVTNARRYGDEQRAKADLEALVNTSPVGVLVADVASRSVVMANREARRIVGAPPVGRARLHAGHVGADLPAHGRVRDRLRRTADGAGHARG